MQNSNDTSNSKDNVDTDLHSVVQTKEPVDKVLVARLASAAVILALFVIFALQNTESVEIDFLAWSFNISTFLMVVLSAITGVVVWTLAGAYSRRAKKKHA